MPHPELAVLTGDIIRSSRLAPGALDAAMVALAAGASAMHGWDGAVRGRFTRFRGDGWQCLAPSSKQALRAALFLRAHVRALDLDADTRISVGIGAGTLPTDDLAETTGLAAAGGPAFELSGRGLDTMRQPEQFGVAWTDPPPAAALIGAVFALADEISRLWTARQAETLIDTLAPGDAAQREIAGKRGVSQQAIAKRLSAGGDWALQRALAAVEASG
jgi:hypothetical protein